VLHVMLRLRVRRLSAKIDIADTALVEKTQVGVGSRLYRLREVAKSVSAQASRRELESVVAEDA